ncbi:MAG: DegT/DnrJ/EryC1/StrS family aminotransferase [Inquilinaceae bacterium]
MSKPAPIPVMRPKLPGLAALAPYIGQIDDNQTYSNFGPLTRSFEAAMAARFAIEPNHVVTLGNGSLGLTLALRALDLAPASLCMVPAYTFPGTPGAVIAAGLTPWFVDVDPASWALEPGAAADLLRLAPGPVAAVVPVSVFGRPVDVAGWDVFTEKTGVACVIDGAAAYDGARIGRTPTMISLHATKIFGVGEGGLVLSTDTDLVHRVRQLSSFGFPLDGCSGDAARRPVCAGTNAKISEYTAAVGLAGLDGWADLRHRFGRVHEFYRQHLADLPWIEPQPGRDDGWLSATFNVRVSGQPAPTLASALAEHGVETRRWWGEGCHRSPAFADCPRVPLPVTEALADSVIGLPFFAHMTLDQVERVVRALATVTGGTAKRPAPRAQKVGKTLAW